MQFDILVRNHSEGGYIFENETNLALNYYRTQLQLKNSFLRIILNYVKFEFLTSVFSVKCLCIN